MDPEPSPPDTRADQPILTGESPAVQPHPMGRRGIELALGAGVGAAGMLLITGALVVGGVLGLPSSPPAATPAPLTATPLRATARPSTLTAAATRLAVAALAPATLAVSPDLPVTIDLAPADVPWTSGDTVQIAGEGGANLRPYPVTDDTVAAASLGLAQGAEVQVISSFRLEMTDGSWWYVRVPDVDPDATPVFGWVREDLLEAPSA
jgi:hypothetical protein